MRTFIALLPDNKTTTLLTQLQERLLPLDADMTPPANLHCTLVFCGELDEKQLNQTQLALHNIMLPKYIQLSVQEITLFGRGQKKRLVLLLNPTPELIHLRGTITDMLTRRGASVETERPFRPHITIATVITAPENLRPFQGDAVFSRLSLFTSEVDHHGSTYHEVSGFDLKQ